MTASYTWTAAGSGDWSLPANWYDVTTGAPATAPPGAADTARIDGPTTGSIAVSGTASLLNLGMAYNVALVGDFAIGSATLGVPVYVGLPPYTSTTSTITLAGTVTAGTVTVGDLGLVPGLPSSQVTDSGLIGIGTGALLSAATIDLSAGALTLDGGSLDVGSMLTIGTFAVPPFTFPRHFSNGTLDIANGGQAHLAGLTLYYGDLDLAPSGILEIGTAGTAAPGTITVDPDATLSVGLFLWQNGTIAINAPVLNNGEIVSYGKPLGNITNNGRLDGTNASFVNVVNNGSIVVLSGSVSAITGAGRIVDTGVLTLGPNVGGTVELSSSLFTTATLDIALGAGTTIDTSDTPPILGFTAGEVITLEGVTADTAHYDPTGSGIGTLTLQSAGTAVASLTLLGSYAADDFNVSSSTGVSTLTTTAACFASGTRIRTDHGDIAVEQLRIGDAIVTTRGHGLRPVRWIGHRTVAPLRHARPADVLPVRIAADAFAAGQPRRDLLLSPDHAVFVGGVLIPVRHLLNGDSIAQLGRRAITYWHVELDAHDVLLAEGLPAESYLDTGDRTSFANGGVVTALHPSFAALTREAAGCAPLAVTGPIVAALRQRLRRRATAQAVTSARPARRPRTMRGNVRAPEDYSATIRDRNAPIPRRS